MFRFSLVCCSDLCDSFVVFVETRPLDPQLSIVRLGKDQPDTGRETRSNAQTATAQVGIAFVETSKLVPGPQKLNHKIAYKYFLDLQILLLLKNVFLPA